MKGQELSNAVVIFNDEHINLTVLCHVRDCYVSPAHSRHANDRNFRYSDDDCRWPVPALGIVPLVSATSRLHSNVMQMYLN